MNTASTTIEPATRIECFWDVTLCIQAPFNTSATDPQRWGIDKPLARDHRGRIYLPGSLVHGRMLQESNNWKATDHFAQLLGAVGKPANTNNAPARKHLVWDDLLLDTNTLAGTGHAYTRIAMNSNTGSAQKHMLQTIESPALAGTKLTFKGQVRGFCPRDEQEQWRMQIEHALRLVQNLGSDRSTGHGLVLGVKVEKGSNPLPCAANLQWPTDEKGQAATAIVVNLQFDRPLVVTETNNTGNYFEGTHTLAGNVLKGAWAETAKLLGKPLPSGFDDIVFRHGFCAKDVAQRPTMPPHSLVEHDKTIVDIAHQSCAVLLRKNGIKDAKTIAPLFELDWKEPNPKVDGDTTLMQHLGWVEPSQGLRVRTAIDGEKRAAAEGELFAYRHVLHEYETHAIQDASQTPWQPYTWHSVIDLSDVPENQRSDARTHLLALLQHGALHVGKTRARARVHSLQAHAPVQTNTLNTISPDSTIYLCLQTPALLTKRGALTPGAGAKEMRQAYADYFSKASNGALTLHHHYARQTLRGGGYLQHRFKTPNASYSPWVLTEAGAVFALEVNDAHKAKSVLQKWLHQGLPVAEDWCADWKTNPYIPANGFGEIAINLDIHSKWSPEQRNLSIFPIEVPVDEPASLVAPSQLENSSAQTQVTKDTSNASTSATGSDCQDGDQVQTNQGLNTSIPQRRQPTPYSHRWRVTTTFTVVTPLSLGDGRCADDRVMIKDSDGQSTRTAMHNTIATDCSGQPYLPGTSLKGCLRSLAERVSLGNASSIQDLFGLRATEVSEDNKRQGAYVTFCNAYIAANAPTQADHPENLTLYNSTRRSYLEASTAIDPDTLTANDRKLYHDERVWPGVQFAASWLIEARSQEEGTRMVADLLALLSKANDEGGLPLGADTGRGYGRMQHGEVQTQYFGIDEFECWIKNDKSNKCPWMYAKPVKENDLQKTSTFTATSCISLPLHIQFTGLYLVNDPSRTQTGKDGAMAIAHTPRIDAKGHPVLPARTLHGALRAQSERILRTLGDSADKHQALINKLYGSTEGAAWLRQTKVPQCTKPGKKHEQDFIAIDRFTGGGADGAKFNTHAFYGPEFEACLSLPTSKTEEEKACMGLLWLTLRDLECGDIPLGWGKRKGYGRCKVFFGGMKSSLATALQAIGPTAQQTLEGLKTYLGDKEPAWVYPDTQSWGVNQWLEWFVPTQGKQNVPAANAKTATAKASKQPQAQAQAQAQDEADLFHNSYHFVPLPKTLLPTWMQRVAFKDKYQLGHHSHARYAQETTQPQTQAQEKVFCGQLRCRIQAVTPFVVGGRRGRNDDQSQNVYAYRVPHHSDTQDNNETDKSVTGQLCIPASSLKGMISAVAEAASGSSMRVMETKSQISYRMKVSTARKLLAQVVMHEGSTYLAPVAKDRRVDHRELAEVGQTNTIYAYCLKSSPDGQPLRAMDTNKAHELYLLPLPVYSSPTLVQINGFVPVNPLALNVFYRLAYEATEKGFKASSKQTAQKGAEHQALPYHLVKYVKDHRATSWIKDSTADKRNDKESPQNNFEKYQLQLKNRSVVWYRGSGDNLRFGYSQIWRDLIIHTTPDGTKRPATYADFVGKGKSELLPFNPKRQAISPAELLLGFVEILEKEDKKQGDTQEQTNRNADRKQALAFAGKLRVSDAMPAADAITQVAKELVALKVLDSPKPPSPAMYFSSMNGTPQYISKDQLNTQTHHINGRKRYLHALRDSNQEVQPLNEKGQAASNGREPWRAYLIATGEGGKDENAKQRIHAELVQAGAALEFDIAFDNLSASELQLLMFALQPAPEFEHKLGLGKSIGLGSMKLCVKGLTLIDRQKRYQTTDLNITGEIDVCPGTTSELAQNLADAYLNGSHGDTQAMQALIALGDPGKVKYPVHVPQVKDTSIVHETFKWFGDNDAEAHQMLTPVDPASSSLPDLKRLPKREPASNNRPRH